MLDVVKKAADAVGGLPMLADRLDCSRQALHQWEKVPRGRVLEIEEATGGKVSRSMMRPDIYPPEHDPYIEGLVAAVTEKDAAA